MGRVTDAELDAKIARLANRVRERSQSTREQLEAIGALELAEAARATFQARLVYLGPDSGFPHGHPYDFELRGGPPMTGGSERKVSRGTVRQPLRP